MSPSSDEQDSLLKSDRLRQKSNLPKILEKRKTAPESPQKTAGWISGLVSAFSTVQPSKTGLFGLGLSSESQNYNFPQCLVFRCSTFPDILEPVL